MGKYVNETFPNFIKEIEANPKLANNPQVAEAFGITDLGEASGKQRLVEYEDRFSRLFLLKVLKKEWIAPNNYQMN